MICPLRNLKNPIQPTGGGWGGGEIRNKVLAAKTIIAIVAESGENFFSAGEKPVMDFENEWGDDFEFTPDFDIPDKAETKLDELGDKMVDAAKKLEDAVVQLVLDLDINKDKPEDKE